MSMYRRAVGLLALAMYFCWAVVPAQAQEDAIIPGLSSSSAKPKTAKERQLEKQKKQYESFKKLTDGAEVTEGMIRLYQNEGQLYAELKRSDMNRPFLCPIAVARGLGMGGDTLNSGEQWVLMFRKVDDRIHLVRRNIHFTAKKGTPLEKAVETTYMDSILKSILIRGINPEYNIRPSKAGILISFNDIFMSDFAQLGLGTFDASRSYWHKVKGFDNNIEIQVAATYSGRRSGGFGGDSGVIDSRGTTAIIHYGLCKLPPSGYTPRLADDRVGYFLTALKDFSKEGQDGTFVRYINRWRVEPATPMDPKKPNRLVAPKKKVIFWIEDTVPMEYRAYVREGILEWNKAFEKIGFRDVIEVRQQEGEDFDPEDINYNTFRWITTNRTFARGPSRANPFSGELLDADIVFDASWIRYWKQEYQVMQGSGPMSFGFDDSLPSGTPIPSSVEAIRKGWNLLTPSLARGTDRLGWNDRLEEARRDPAQREDVLNEARAMALMNGICECTAHKRSQIGLAGLALAAAGKADAGAELPEELLGQAIKEVVMHEVGHTIGLRHNFKASTMLTNDQLHDTKITREKGLVGSVMDYSPANIAAPGQKQGDYFTTKLGPYDYWAIEYGYKPLKGGTKGELKELQKIASRGAEPGLHYATDEDMYGAADPLTNVYDLGADPMQYAQDRILMTQGLMKDLAERIVKEGEGYQRLRVAFNMLLNEYGDAAHFVSNFVGGELIHRDHRGDPDARDPFVPVKGEKQREALKFVKANILTDQPFKFPPELLRKLAADRWYHWGNTGMFGSVEFQIYNRILGIQRVVMRHMLSPSVLSRVQNNALKSEKDDKPLTIAEMFRCLTDSVWEEYPVGGAEGAGGAQPVDALLRRNLQRSYVQDLSRLLVGSGSAPADARSLARMHLNEIAGRVDTALEKSRAELDDTTKAHLLETSDRIKKVLSASIQIAQP